jgi:geranylgeranyl reductase family protein
LPNKGFLIQILIINVEEAQTLTTSMPFKSVNIYTSDLKLDIMNRTEEIVIAGGGPAGAYCAYELARQGFDPVILDHSYPREKPCGGGILPYVLKMFPFLEEFRSLGFSFGNFRIISCINTEAISKGLENGFCVSRKLFDKKLLDMAIQSGARFSKEKVIDVRNTQGKWKIRTDKAILSSKILVGADGVNSIVRRRTVGHISAKNLALAIGYLTPTVSKDQATIKFLTEIPGYIWVFPGRNYANIGVGSDLQYGNQLKLHLDSFINSNFPQINITSRYAAMLPSATEPNFFTLPCCGENWLLIGDAAGHVDPISGGGILYALWGGKLAAQAIMKNDLKAFDESWRKEYGVNLLERCKNKEAFYDPLKSTMALLAGLANNTYFWPTT